MRNENDESVPIPVEGAKGPIDYPDTYGDALKPRFIREYRTVVRDQAAKDDSSKWEWFCLECSFRPWLDTGDAASVTLTVEDATGARSTLAMRREGDRWVAPRALAPGERAWVAKSGVVDAYDNRNGAPSNVVRG
jgi:hypothetical protein